MIKWGIKACSINAKAKINILTAKKTSDFVNNSR